MEDIVKKMPQHPWLCHHADEAESLARAASWCPPSARQFITLALDHRKRLIQNGQQLIEVVSESLDRLSSKLRDERSRVKYLWFPSGGRFRPRDEEDISDYVTSHLDDDLQQRGVIVNREVQIRHGTGSGSGQSTDIHVDAVVPGARMGTYERLYAIVEVKGNWHDELMTAMQTQLRDRYLKDNRCRNGMYLVGWFSCPGWDDKDYRKRKCPHMSLEKAKQFFVQQAAGLSTDGYIIRSYVLNLSLI